MPLILYIERCRRYAGKVCNWSRFGKFCACMCVLSANNGFERKRYRTFVWGAQSRGQVGLVSGFGSQYPALPAVALVTSAPPHVSPVIGSIGADVPALGSRSERSTQAPYRLFDVRMKRNPASHCRTLGTEGECVCMCVWCSEAVSLQFQSGLGPGLELCSCSCPPKLHSWRATSLFLTHLTKTWTTTTETWRMVPAHVSCIPVSGVVSAANLANILIIVQYTKLKAHSR